MSDSQIVKTSLARPHAVGSPSASGCVCWGGGGVLFHKMEVQLSNLNDNINITIRHEFHFFLFLRNRGATVESK
jgi:hypothetical protein